MKASLTSHSMSCVVIVACVHAVSFPQSHSSAECGALVEQWKERRKHIRCSLNSSGVYSTVGGSIAPVCDWEL